MTGMPYKRKSVAHQKASTPRTQPRDGWSQVCTLSNMALQTEDADPAIQEHDNLTALMQAIDTCQTTLTGKIDTIQIEMGLICKDMDKFRTRLMEAEHCMGDAEDLLGNHSTSLHTLTTRVRALEYHAEDMENRNQRNNPTLLLLSNASSASYSCKRHSPRSLQSSGLTEYRQPVDLEPLHARLSFVS